MNDKQLIRQFLQAWDRKRPVELYPVIAAMREAAKEPDHADTPSDRASYPAGAGHRTADGGQGAVGEDA